MSDPKNPLIQTVRPPLRFHYDLTLVRRGYWSWKASDFERVPDMAELLELDEAWLDDLSTYADWVRFHDDAYKQQGK